MPLSQLQPLRLQIVGRGRVATALAHALDERGGDAGGGSAITFDRLPLAGRGANGTDPSGRPVDVVLLAVPDGEIAAAAAEIVPGPVLGHCSGVTGLDVFAGRPGFSMHPLLTVTGAGTRFADAWAAVASTDDGAADIAAGVAAVLGLRVFEVRDDDRAAYHAAASIASNFLVTLEGLAEELAATAGVPREALVPLADAALRNWADRGARAALTGPIVRGDEETVRLQRQAVVERLPGQVGLFDALAEATRELASEPPRGASGTRAGEENRV